MENCYLLINYKFKYAFYILYSKYYATSRDYPHFIKYYKLKHSVNNQDLSGLNNSKILFSISKFYSFMNNIDSSLIYANYALEEEMSSGGSAISDNLHLYYRNIGDI